MVEFSADRACSDSFDVERIWPSDRDCHVDRNRSHTSGADYRMVGGAAGKLTFEGKIALDDAAVFAVDCRQAHFLGITGLPA